MTEECQQHNLDNFVHDRKKSLGIFSAEWPALRKRMLVCEEFHSMREQINIVLRWSSRHEDHPHGVGVTGTWTPAGHNEGYVTTLEELLVFACTGNDNIQILLTKH